MLTSSLFYLCVSLYNVEQLNTISNQHSHDNTSCPPRQTCLTINQYTNPSNNYLKQNNTVDIFLPGEHVMERHMNFRNVENVTLQTYDTGSYPQLLPRYICSSKKINVPFAYNLDDHIIHVPIPHYCSTIKMKEVFNVTISCLMIGAGINISGIIIENSNNIHIQENNIIISSKNIVNDTYGVGISVTNESYDIRIESLNTSNVLFGILTWGGNNVMVYNSSFQNCHYSGLYSLETNQISLENVNFTVSFYYGLLFYNCTRPSVLNVSSQNNSVGVGIWLSRNATITNVLSVNNWLCGVIAVNSTNTAMTNIASIYYQRVGIDILVCDNTTLTNISSMKSYNLYGIGLEIFTSTNTKMKNVVSIDNQYYRISVARSRNTVMINISSINNKNFNIDISQSINTELINVQSSMNVNSEEDLPKSGISLNSCWTVHIQNISVLVNRQIDYNAISSSTSADILLEDSVFTGLMPDLQRVATKVTDQPAIIGLFETEMTFKNCKFIGNSVSSILLTHSNITLGENVLFENNSAISGAVLIFSRSILIVSEHTNVVFHNNFASQYGAAIYIVTEELPEKSVLVGDLITTLHTGRPSFFDTTGTQCFIQVNAVRSNTAHLTFINNTAMKGGDVVYGELVATGYDGDWNCLLSFKNISDMTGQSSARQITSEPSRVCLCHDTSPDCLIVADPTTHTLYPGETLTVSAAVVGQDFGTVTGYVYAQVIDTAHNNATVSRDQMGVSYDNGACSNLNYTVYSSCEECKVALILTSDGRKVSQLKTSIDNQRLIKSWSILQ